jgi:hypothetical protein
MSEGSRGLSKIMLLEIKGNEEGDDDTTIDGSIDLIASTNIDKKYFGEGSTYIND